MPGATGSNPTITTVNPGTHSTLDATQQNVQSQLASLLSNTGLFSNNYVANGGQLAAPLTSAQTGTINDLTGVTGSANINAVAGQGGVSNAISTLEGVNNSGPANFQSYYENSVVQPLEQTFNQQTLPSLERAFAAGGGTTGSDYALGVNTAAENLDNSLASASSSTALQEYNDNQTNKLTSSSELGTIANEPLTALTTALTGQTQAQSTSQLADTLGQAYTQQSVGNESNLATLLQNLLGTQTTAANDVVSQAATPSALGSILSGVGSLGGLFASQSGGTSAAMGLATLLGM